MNIKYLFYISLISILLIDCQVNNSIVIDQETLRNDWISNDNKFIFIEDSIIYSNLSLWDRLIYKFELTNDTLTIFSHPDFKNTDTRILRYKIVELDSVKLKIKGITPNDTAVTQFWKINANKKNNKIIKTIDFSSGPCFGYCPVIDLKITEDSILYFYGYKHVKHKGFYNHKLSKQEYNRIQTKINSISFDSVKLAPMCPDAHNLSLYIKTDFDSINISGIIDETVNFRLIVLLDYMLSLDKLLDMNKFIGKELQFKDDFNRKWYKND